MSETIEKPWWALIGLIFVVFIALGLYAFLALAYVNPCWKMTVNGLKPIERHLPAEMIFDGQCLRKVVITTDARTCEIACNEHPDDSSTCQKKCHVKEAKSFIVILPKSTNTIKGAGGGILSWNLGTGILGGDTKLGRAMAHGSIDWLFDGDPDVFVLTCQLKTVNIKSCNGKDGTWLCDPGVTPKRYKITVDKKSQYTCNLESSEIKLENKKPATT